ncbi:MAG: transposase [bacterium]|nr:transposase [bacterium]
MPSRRDIFTNSEVYHIYNKTPDSKIIFDQPAISHRFFDLMRYYRSSKSDIRYSKFVLLPSQIREYKEKEINDSRYFKVDILAYCLMPNHFHILIKQKKDSGVIRFMSDILNAITRYYNILYGRKGQLFLTQFRSRHIVTREQLIHVSRYIHLNPYSSGLITKIEELCHYPLSSFFEYTLKKTLCNTDIILSQFNDDKETYTKFVFNNADYQRTLDWIKHAEKWR